MLAYLFKVRTKNRFHKSKGKPSDDKAQGCYSERKIFTYYMSVVSSQDVSISAVINYLKKWINCWFAIENCAVHSIMRKLYLHHHTR